MLRSFNKINNKFLQYLIVRIEIILILARK